MRREPQPAAFVYYRVARNVYDFIRLSLRSLNG